MSKIRINVCLEKPIVKEIDKLRGLVPRSAYLRSIIKNFVKRKTRKAGGGANG